MNQTRIESFIEANVNVVVGFVVSLLFWHFVIVPFYDLPVSTKDNLVITGWFTALSVARSYFMRRFFNAGLHKAVRNFTRSICGRLTSN